jgi:hypothetical protein
MKKYYRLLIVGGFFLPLVAGAVGVSVNPARLTIEAGVEEERTEIIIVSNPARDVAIFEIFPDEFETMVRVTPTSFVLESGDQKKVTVEVSGKTAGRFETTLSVLARPLSESAFNAASGVKIPLSFEIAPADQGLALTLAALPFSGRLLGVFGYALMLVAYILFFRYAVKHLRKSKV